MDGFLTFGPLYGRWLFPYERANGWISRQCLKKGAEEATVMETYVVSTCIMIRLVIFQFLLEQDECSLVEWHLDSRGLNIYIRYIFLICANQC